MVNYSNCRADDHDRLLDNHEDDREEVDYADENDRELWRLHIGHTECRRILMTLFLWPL